MSALEKKLVEEKKQRTDFQQKLEAERKNKKEANAERVSLYHNSLLRFAYVLVGVLVRFLDFLIFLIFSTPIQDR